MIYRRLLGSNTPIRYYYEAFKRHFRTQIAPEKNKNGLNGNQNSDLPRERNWPPEPKVEGSNAPWRT